MLAALLVSSNARAGDGAYGRFDGDMDLSAAAGAALTAGAPSFVARASAVYVATAGAYATYADSFGSADARVDRSIAAGFTLKPLFWARFARNWETGQARLDLFLDSLALEIGAFWASPHLRGFQSEPGLELAIGVGFPIFAEATGPFIELRGAVRYRPVDFDGRRGLDIVDSGGMLSLTLAWHHIVNAHIVDAGDRAAR